jgi:isopentenyldiphosphate isomerase
LNLSQFGVDNFNPLYYNIDRKEKGMKKMITVKTFSMPISKLCEVRYYVVGRMITDAHFTPESEFVVDNRYFNTKEEAEQFKKQCWEETPWIEYKICEEILKIFD